MTKFKGKCASDYIEESKRVYRKLLESEKYCKMEMNAINGNDDMSSSYKRRKADELQEHMSMRRVDMKTKLDELEKGFANMAYENADLAGEGLSRNLVTALSSGINYTPNELLYMAREYKNGKADSRLLHDYAKAQGYDLNNYISPEQEIKNFHELNTRFRISADDLDNQTFMKIPESDVDYIGSQFLDKILPIMEEDMDICETPKTIDEAIARDMAAQKKAEQAKIDDDKFLEGFGVEKTKTDLDYYEKDEEPEEEQDRIAELAKETTDDKSVEVFGSRK